ncbi:MAG TPA: prenyltransferase [Actinomycetota bacterium]
MPGADVLEGAEERYTHAVVAFVGEDGYPMSVATEFRVDAERNRLLLRPFTPAPPPGTEVDVTLSHIRPQPGVGYDERRYAQAWGPLRPNGGQFEVPIERTQGWDEQDMPFFEYSERGVAQAHRYLGALSKERGTRVRPRLAAGWLFLRATRLPFLTATFVPVALGSAVAAANGPFHWWLALLTLLGGAFVHLGLNVANDVFDTMSGADQANTTPTQFSGGSRVIHYGLISMRGMALLATAFYAAGAAIGVFLAVDRGFWPLIGLGAAGMAISLAYTAPPLRLVHRGVGEIAVALGFGPIMVLGAFYVQAQRFTWEAGFVSIPVAILIALVLYVNEIPDRAGDRAAGKRTLPVRLSRRAVIAVYVAAVAVAYLAIAAGALSGLMVHAALIGLVTIPMAARVARELGESYENPYGLMPAMARNIKLHLFTGMLLVAAYTAAAIAAHTMAHPPLFLR